MSVYWYGVIGAAAHGGIQRQSQFHHSYSHSFHLALGMSAIHDQIVLSKSQTFQSGVQGRQASLCATVGYMSLTTEHALLPFHVAGQCLLGTDSNVLLTSRDTPSCPAS